MAQFEHGSGEATTLEALAQTLDLGHLDRQTMGDRALADEVLQLFVIQARTITERLAAPIDKAERQRLVHTLAGSARGIGAWGVAALASAAEASAEDSDLLPLFEALRAVDGAISARGVGPLD